MSTSPSTTAPPPFSTTLRRLYSIRFVFAVAWAVILFQTADSTGMLLTGLLVIYPLVDAAAVWWQLRFEADTSGPRVAEWTNVVVSTGIAIALGWASTVSLGAALGIWGAWALASGATQFITAVLHRSSGGQVPQLLSGAISTLAGVAFLTQASQDPTSIAGVGGYAILGGIFFLISALRLAMPARQTN